MRHMKGIIKKLYSQPPTNPNTSMDNNLFRYEGGSDSRFKAIQVL